MEHIKPGPDIVEDILGTFGFRLVWNVYETTSVEVKAYEVTGRDSKTDTPSFERLGAMASNDDVEDVALAQPYLTGFMKWDCCCHFNFGRESYIHMCGRESFVKHVALIAYLHKRAPELMGSDEGEDGRPRAEGT